MIGMGGIVKRTKRRISRAGESVLKAKKGKDDHSRCKVEVKVERSKSISHMNIKMSP